MIGAATRQRSDERVNGQALPSQAIGKTYRQCPLCESHDLEYEFIVERAPICSCKRCGLLFLNPQFNSAGDASSSIIEPGRLADLHEANAVDRIEQLIAYSGLRSGKLLIVGTDDLLSVEAQRRGFEPLPLTAQQFEASNLSELRGPFDACLFFSALEKMTDPLGSLRKLHDLLGTSGVLMVVSPTTDSKAARLFGSSWWEFKRTNLFYFSVDTLQSLLIKAGFGDPLIYSDKTLVSLNYLKQRLASNPRVFRGRFRFLRAVLSVSPLPRDKAFRSLDGRTRFLVRRKSPSPKPVLSVIVPAYNESATFCELVDQLLAKTIDGVDIEIIIVESNSTDGTRDLALQYSAHSRIRLILEEKPSGKGHAVRSGLEAATGDVIIIQDADLEYDINDYDALISPLLQYQNNFVLGSRHIVGKNSWKIREFSDSPTLSAYFNFGHLFFLLLFNFIYGQQLTDPFTMFKVFRRECLYGLTFETNRFDFDHELIIKLLRKGYKVIELPVNYKSRSVSEGKKVSAVRDPLTWIWAYIKYRFSPLYSTAKVSDRPPTK